MSGTIDSFLAWAMARDLSDAAWCFTYVIVIRAVVWEFFRPVLRMLGWIACRWLNQRAGMQFSSISSSVKPAVNPLSRIDSGASSKAPSSNREDL